MYITLEPIKSHPFIFSKKSQTSYRNKIRGLIEYLKLFGTFHVMNAVMFILTHRSIELPPQYVFSGLMCGTKQ